MPAKKTEKVFCENCAEPFLVAPCNLRRGRGRFCSPSCASTLKVLPLIGKKLEENPNWKGGLTQSSKGYWYVKVPGHPRADHRGYVKRADLVLEEKLGRTLMPDEIAHHRNELKGDDSPDNLEVMTSSAHAVHHNQARRVAAL